MSVLQMSQNSNLWLPIEGSQLKIRIKGEICDHTGNQVKLRSNLEQRQVLDLLLVPMSPNRIARHLSRVFEKHMSTWKIKQTVIAQGERIDALNDRFDRIAGRKISLIQIDETFKGQRVSILVVIDAVTGYILHLQWLESRTEENILNQLSPIRHLLKNVKLVLTDGAPYFPGVVEKLCPNAQHQVCLIHVMRGLYTHLRPSRVEYRKKLGAFQSITKKVKKIEAKMRNKQYSRKKLLSKLKYWKQKRINTRYEYGVRAYQKEILEKYPELKKYNEKINLIRAKLRSLEHTIEGLMRKEVHLKVEHKIAHKQKNKAWGEYMVKCRLLHQFYRLFQLKGNAYDKKRQKMIARLRGRISEGCEFSQEILRILTEMKNLDSVNKDDCPVRLDLAFINTNALESINSRIRPFLECLRKITDSIYIQTYFKLLRFYLNTTKPFSGVRSDTSPIERYGYDLRGRDYLDLLLDGLPPGPQYEVNHRNLNLTRAAPNMVGKCKL